MPLSQDTRSHCETDGTCRITAQSSDSDIIPTRDDSSPTIHQSAAVPSEASSPRGPHRAALVVVPPFVFELPLSTELQFIFRLSPLPLQSSSQTVFQPSLPRTANLTFGAHDPCIGDRRDGCDDGRPRNRTRQSSRTAFEVPSTVERLFAASSVRSSAIGLRNVDGSSTCRTSIATASESERIRYARRPHRDTQSVWGLWSRRCWTTTRGFRASSQYCSMYCRVSSSLSRASSQKRSF